MGSHGNSCRKALPLERRANQCGTATTRNLIDSSPSENTYWADRIFSSPLYLQKRTIKLIPSLPISSRLPSLFFIAFLFQFLFLHTGFKCYNCWIKAVTYRAMANQPFLGLSDSIRTLVLPVKLIPGR